VNTDYSLLTETEIERLQAKAQSSAESFALDAAWKVVRMRAHVKAQRRGGLNAASLDILKRELSELEFWARYQAYLYQYKQAPLYLGAAALTDAAYKAFVQAVTDYADWIEYANGQPDYYSASPSNTALIESYWQSYLDTCHNLHPFMV